MSNKVLTVDCDRRDVDLVWNKRGFALSDKGQLCSSLMITAEQSGSIDWNEKQSIALHEYFSTHVNEDISQSTLSVYKLFGNYIHAQLRKIKSNEPPKVLDVGCGIGQRLPIYIRDIHDEISYFGLDAYEVNVSRDYPLIVGRIEDFSYLDAFKHQFDVFVFGTSLDHFEDLDLVADSVKRLASPNAKIVFWIGLHDPQYAALEEAYRSVVSIFKQDGLIKKIISILHLFLVRGPRVLLAILVRNRRLQRRENLDPYHFWYFLEADLPEILSKFGKIEDITYATEDGSVFVTCGNK